MIRIQIDHHTTPLKLQQAVLHTATCVYVRMRPWPPCDWCFSYLSSQGITWASDCILQLHVTFLLLGFKLLCYFFVSGSCFKVALLSVLQSWQHIERTEIAFLKDPQCYRQHHSVILLHIGANSGTVQNKSKVAGHIIVGIIMLVVIVIIQYCTVRANRQNFCVFIIASARMGHLDLHALL